MSDARAEWVDQVCSLNPVERAPNLAEIEKVADDDFSTLGFELA
jgi:hypothetical protein